WLKQVTIDLWIDQAGFRTLRPSMSELHASVDATGDTSSGITSGVAEFTPMRTETFACRYTTVDGLPTLEVLCVGCDMSHDCIS
ncbi:hypothetical protein BU15DRAFT_20174, partial [Melanogaster broomeanus]